MSINIDPTRAVIRDLRHVRAQSVFMNDRLTELEASIRTLIAEVEYLRGERAAVVAWLREQDATIDFRPRVWPMAEMIERGEHRREDER